MNYETIIIGAGYSGLEQAEKIKAQGKKNVLLIEFEAKAGGRPWDGEINKIPIFDTLYHSKVIKVKKNKNDFIVCYQNKDGKHELTANEVILTTGSVERERFFDFITGDRPSGDMVPKLALNLYQRGYAPGYHPLIVRANEYAEELIEKLNTVDEVDVQTMEPKEYEVLSVKGSSRVEELIVKNRITGEKKAITADALIYANGLMPMTHSVLNLGVEMDKDKFILTNGAGETSLAGFYAYGDVAKVK